MLRSVLLTLIHKTDIVLDLGAGAGIIEFLNLKGHAAKVCGVDLDSRVLQNIYLDEAKVSDGERLPYQDGEFDLVFADNVLEHLEFPVKVFNEVKRVLKPGGVFVFKTPNKTHYVPLIARLTPHSFHQFVNRIRGRQAEDTFPTFYRANCRADVRKIADQSDLKIIRLTLTEGRPEYLRISVLTYLLGIAYERLVNSTNLLSFGRVLMIGVLEKPVGFNSANKEIA